MAIRAPDGANNQKSIVHLLSPRCTDHGGCADQFDGLGACVNLAAPLQISELFNRFVFVVVLVLVFFPVLIFMLVFVCSCLGVVSTLQLLFRSVNSLHEKLMWML